MLEAKDEDKEEGEVSTQLEEVPKFPKVVSQESKPLLLRPPLPSLPLPPSKASKASLPADLPNFSSTCCDIPVVCSDHSSQPYCIDGGQPYITNASQQCTISKVILSAVSPWLASLIEGTSTYISFPEWIFPVLLFISFMNDIFLRKVPDLVRVSPSQTSQPPS